MNKIYDFSSHPDITGEELGNSIILRGAKHILTKIAKELTITNQSISYRIKMLNDKLKRLNSSAWVKPGTIEETVAEIEKLKEQEVVKFFDYISPEEIEVPKGLYWYASDNLMRCNLRKHPFPEGEIEIKPRPYQTEAVEKLIKHKRAMVELATGLGKTVVLTDLVNTLLKNHGEDFRVMVVVPTVELMAQTLNFIKKFIPDATGLGGSGRAKKSYTTGCRVMVGVINSCVQYADRFHAIIIDEVHHSASNMYTTLVYSAINVKYVYGMTATPCRADGMVMGVHANCGPIVMRRDTKWGVENGFLCPSIFRIMNIRKPTPLFDTKLLEVKAYGIMIKDPKLIDAVVKTVQFMLERNRKILFLTKHVKPSEVFAEALSKALGYEVRAAHAKFKNPLEQFKKGETNILVANDDLCGEGVDIPDVDCMFNLTQRSSESKIRQILGRGLRIKEGKDKLIFFDVVFVGFGHDEKKADGTKYWADRYTNSARKRIAIYHEIGEVVSKDF